MNLQEKVDKVDEEFALSKEKFEKYVQATKDKELPVGLNLLGDVIAGMVAEGVQNG